MKPYKNKEKEKEKRMNLILFSNFLSIIITLFNLFHPSNAKQLLRSNNVNKSNKERIKKQNKLMDDQHEHERHDHYNKRDLSNYDNYLLNSTSFPFDNIDGLKNNSDSNINGNTNIINKLHTHDSSIVGGTAVSSSRSYPYLVSILEIDQWTNTAIHQCSGTLLTPNIVVTAGHCVEYPAMRIIDVGRFDWYDDDNVEPYRIEQIYIHPEFNGNFFINDIALIKLNRDVIGIDKFAQLVQIQHDDDNDNYNLIVNDGISIIGWGLTSDNGEPSKNLLQADVNVISNIECQKTYGKFILDAMFCAYADGKDACQGDSGGPAFKIINNEIYQIGIISWGESCGVNPGVYTNLESPIIMNFINKYMCDILSPQSCNTNGIFYGQSSVHNNSSKSQLLQQQQGVTDEIVLQKNENNKCVNSDNDDCAFISIMPSLGCLMTSKECPEVCCPTSCKPDLGCVD